MSINSSLSPIFFQQSPISVIGEDNVAAEEIIHYRWHVNDFVVCLIEEYGFLKYKTIDKSQQEIYTDNIEIPESKTLEKMVSSLKKCKVMIDESGMARFFMAYQTWNDANREIPQHLEEAVASSYDPTVEISLIRVPEDLVWNVFQRFSKESSFLSFQKVTVPSSRCHPETVALIEQIKKKAFKDPNLLACLICDFTARVLDPQEIDEKRYEIHLNELKAHQKQGYKSMAMLAAGGTLGVGASICLMAPAFLGMFVGGTISTAILAPFTFKWDQSSSRRISEFFNKKIRPLNDKFFKFLENGPCLIEIEPISIPSELDPRLRVSKFTWAVTIVNGLKGPSKNHTAIIVEGLANEYFQGSVPDGEYFIHKSEFNPPIRSNLYSLSRLKMYITQGMRRTDIWMRPSKQVIVMLQEIARQQRLHEGQLERGEKIEWAATGSDSWFSRGLDNCFTWTRKSVAMIDIKLGKNFHSGMFAWPRAFTDTFQEQEKSLFVDIKI